MSKIELRDYIATHGITRKPVRVRQYRVFLDGQPVGFIPWDNPKLLLTQPVGPVERMEIEAEAIRVLKRDRIDTCQVPEVEEIEETGEDDNDDFDT